MRTNFLTISTIMVAMAALSQHAQAKVQDSCVQECEEKGANLGGELVHKLALKQITREEYDKLARGNHNDDLVCIRSCKQNRKGKVTKDLK
jgi:predicted subunit of tRNA(5-methylaminomethyl-2-thiouridylate) methyltransferase